MPFDHSLLPEDCAAAAVMADLLAQGRVVHLLSASLCAGAAAALLLAPGGWPAIGPATILAAGLVETWIALRVGFDALCFRRIAEAADGSGLADFDSAMRRLDLLPQGKVGRPLAPRLAGARRLLVIQGVALMIQVASAFLTALIV